MIFGADKIHALLRPNIGWWALLAAASLTAIGMTAMSGAPVPAALGSVVQKQAMWLAVACGAMTVCMLPHTRLVGLATYPVTFVVIALLALTAVPYVPTSLVPVVNGARHWIRLGSMSLQPSELAKIAFILALARYLRHRESYRTLHGLLVPFAIMFVPVILILKEPDLGTAILFPPVLFAVLLAAGARARHISMLLGVAAVIIVVSIVAIYTLPDSMQVLEKHQRLRILALVGQYQHDTRYLSGVGYQQDKAMTLIGAGGLTGMGAEQSATMLRFNWLPEAHNDIIFAVVINRWGFLGGLATLGLYAMMALSFFAIAMRSKNPFARLAVVGFAALILTQMTINMGMCLGVLPIIGISLPFVSYGGTSLVAGFSMVGLALSFAAERPRSPVRSSFEFDHLEAVSS